MEIMHALLHNHFDPHFQQITLLMLQELQNTIPRSHTNAF